MRKSSQLSIIFVYVCLLASCSNQDHEKKCERDYGCYTESTSAFKGKAKEFVDFFVKDAQFVGKRLTTNQVHQIAEKCNDGELTIILRFFSCANDGMRQWDNDWNSRVEKRKCGILIGPGGKVEKFSTQCQAIF